MGCICSKAALLASSKRHDNISKKNNKDNKKKNDSRKLSSNRSSVVPSKRDDDINDDDNIIIATAVEQQGDDDDDDANGTARLIVSPLDDDEDNAAASTSTSTSPALLLLSSLEAIHNDSATTTTTNKAHQRRPTKVTVGTKGDQNRQQLTRIISMPNGTKGEHVAAGWPSWLSSVAPEAIKGWLPRTAESFQILQKIGKGTYSTVYRAQDLQTSKVVALKKVRFVNMDPDSVRFMAREISILRRLDHPNVMKLEGLVTSRMSSTFYLVFEYMEHDLSGLAARSSGIKLTESQIKCYMQQLLYGLEHCHSRDVLHRDIKGSNLLIDNNGILRISDFGLGTVVHPGPLTSRVVTLWYRPPELLLGATEYGAAVDLWSIGCILAELLFGKPIMPGRTEVEQLHKIFKLCGSPSEECWSKSKLPNATSFKPKRPYRRCVSETFKDFPPSSLALLDVLLAIEPENRGSAASALQSEFFKTEPLPCDPSNLPKYPPSKEMDMKLRNEQARRQKTSATRGSGSDHRKGSSRDAKEMPRQDIKPLPLQSGDSKPKSNSAKYIIQECESGNTQNGISHSSQLIPPNAFGSSFKKKDDGSLAGSKKAFGSSARSSGRLDSHGGRSTHSHWPGHSLNRANSSHKQGDGISCKDSKMVRGSKKKILQYSGPLMPLGTNIDEMLKEHERQIQDVVRRTRLDRAKTKNYNENVSIKNAASPPNR
ncbi:hypothetical protein AQUCO_07300007v1 [Aquilegia coerulea]|uniref:Protein kinase domain-containing protein n=1 Tax=Aquilegia coerulea TaxID=218851 RepID=A0A2G5C9Q1_AQUCA|nr:hypothetical protein AQUCO_07300007v1 [Aquilegia coerulea]